MKSLSHRLRSIGSLLLLFLIFAMIALPGPATAQSSGRYVEVKVIRPYEPGKLCVNKEYEIEVYVWEVWDPVGTFGPRLLQAQPVEVSIAAHGAVTGTYPETGVGPFTPARFSYKGSSTGKETLRFIAYIALTSGGVDRIDKTISFEVIQCEYKATIIYQGSMSGGGVTITSVALMGETLLTRTGDELHGQDMLVLDSIISGPKICSENVSTSRSATTITGKIDGGQMSLDFAWEPAVDIVTAQCTVGPIHLSGSGAGGGNPADLGLNKASFPESGGVLTKPAQVALGGTITLIVVPVSP